MNANMFPRLLSLEVLNRTFGAAELLHPFWHVEGSKLGTSVRIIGKSCIRRNHMQNR